MRAVVLSLLVGLSLASGVARAQGRPRARCTATVAAGRAVVLLTLDDMFTAELARLVRLGLDGRIDVQAVLVRPRTLWFDDRASGLTTSTAIRWWREAARFATAGERAIEDITHIDVPRMTLPVPSGWRPEELKVEIRATLRVVTANSLGRVARWIAGSKRQAEGAPTVTAGAGEGAGNAGGSEGPSRAGSTAGLVKSLVSDLEREATGECRPKA